MIRVLSLLMVLIFTTGCISISGAGISNVNSKKGKKVWAEASSMGILSLTVPNAKKLEMTALNKLVAKGATKNITTRLQMRNFMVVQSYTVIATGEK